MLTTNLFLNKWRFSAPVVPKWLRLLGRKIKINQSIDQENNTNDCRCAPKTYHYSFRKCRCLTRVKISIKHDFKIIGVWKARNTYSAKWTVHVSNMRPGEGMFWGVLVCVCTHLYLQYVHYSAFFIFDTDFVLVLFKKKVCALFHFPSPLFGVFPYLRCDPPCTHKRF